jgi:hypothetical protein
MKLILRLASSHSTIFHPQFCSQISLEATFLFIYNLKLICKVLEENKVGRFVFKTELSKYFIQL